MAAKNDEGTPVPNQTLDPGSRELNSMSPIPKIKRKILLGAYDS